jgi:hypothetical protein
MRHVTPRPPPHLRAPPVISIARPLLATAVIMALGCREEETSLLIEVVPGSVDVAALDDVAIRVTGPGLEGGQRTAWAPLRGAGARPFPLSLLIRGTAGHDGPFAIAAEAHTGGAVRASAEAGEPVSLEAGRMVRRQLTLEPVPGSPPPDAGADTATVPQPPPDAGADTATVPQPPPDAGRPDTIADSAADTAPSSGPEPPPDAAPPDVAVRLDVPPPISCEDCDQACLDPRAPPGICASLPEGTACHGNSGMACHGCRCGN